MYALNKRTGDLRWRDDRGDMCVNYSHPVINETENGPELVVAGTGLLIGYDLETGDRKWHARTLLRNIKTTPVAQDGIIYVSLQSGESPISGSHRLTNGDREQRRQSDQR